MIKVECLFQTQNARDVEDRESDEDSWPGDPVDLMFEELRERRYTEGDSSGEDSEHEDSEVDPNSSDERTENGVEDQSSDEDDQLTD